MVEGIETRPMILLISRVMHSVGTKGPGEPGPGYTPVESEDQNRQSPRRAELFLASGRRADNSHTNTRGASGFWIVGSMIASAI